MEALQVAPASSSSDSLLHLLLRAHRRSEGLLLVELDGGAAADLDALRQQHRAAALQEPGAALQVAPHTAPGVATALHKLARRLTKAHMLRLGEHPYQLHRHLDSLQDWLHPSRGGGGAPLHSRIMVSAADRLDRHVDSGLFNIVVGTAADLAPIHLHLGGEGSAGGGAAETVRLGPLLPSDAGPDELFGLLIPGYTLECLDRCTVAVPHSVVPSGDPSLKRSTVVLQWRLSPDASIDGWTVSDLLAGFESVRCPAQPVAQPAPQPVAQPARQPTGVAPTLPPEGLPLYIKTLTNTTFKLATNPQWTVENLRWLIQQEQGIPPDQQRLIFGGKQLEDGWTLQQYGLSKGDTVCLVLRLLGD